MGLPRDNQTSNLKWKITSLRIPTARRLSSWLFYKRDRGFELGTTKDKIQALAVRAGVELEASGLQVQRCNQSATVPASVNNP